MVKFDIEKKTMEIKTAHGTLVVTAFDDPDYPGVNVDFKLAGHENEPAVPITMVEDAAEEHTTSETNGHAVVVRTYGDCDADEYTDRTDILIKDIKKVYEEENK
jgi:hypothetical protein